MAFLHGNISSYNYTSARENENKVKPLQLKYDMGDDFSEDCLFLDVVVPKKVFDRRKSACYEGAPVFVWLHGGAFIFGHKSDPNDGGNPAGLIHESQYDGSDGIIFVAPNYRVGAFGWLAGASLDAINGTANAGLHDQRLALDWVQNNIHLFGGDPKKVTLGGLSAGGGSVVHQITAYGGAKGPAPFQRAFLNSPGYLMVESNFEVENRTQTFLRLANVTSLAEARKLPSEVLRRANGEHVLSADIGFYYGPAVDGGYVPALPGPSIMRGNLNKAFNGKPIDLLLSHAVYEGGEYNAPWVNTDAEFEALLRTLFPSIRGGAVDSLVKMYPGDNPVRTMKLLHDIGFTCNNNWLTRAFGNKTYNYMYDIYPGFHGYDVPYTFYGSPAPSLLDPAYPGPAITLQRYLTNFVKTGDPNGKGLPPFPQQGRNASMNVMRKDGWVTERDGTVNPNCDWLQKALFL